MMNLNKPQKHTRKQARAFRKAHRGMMIGVARGYIGVNDNAPVMLGFIVDNILKR
jgi:hypothetical protein